MATTKKTGDDAEHFVSNILKQYGFLTEIHPRTSRPVIKNGKPVYAHGIPLRISSDNDYHNLFDIKAERIDFMIYAQVKFEKEKSNTSTAQRDIDNYYPYEFPYQRIQTWQVWKEERKDDRRYKDYKSRIQERRGFNYLSKNGKIMRKGKWIEIDIKDLEYHIPGAEDILNSVEEVDE